MKPAVNYEKAVLTALEDTENSFVAYSKRQAQLKSLSEQADASRRAAELRRSSTARAWPTSSPCSMRSAPNSKPRTAWPRHRPRSTST